MNDTLKKSSIGKLHIILTNLEKLRNIQLQDAIKSTICNVDGIQTSYSVFEALNRLFELLKSVEEELNSNSNVDKSFYNDHLTKIKNAFKNNCSNLANPISVIMKSIPKDAIEMLKQQALMHEMTFPNNKGIPDSELDDLKALLSELRAELNKKELDSEFKKLLKNHIFNIEKLIIDYQIFGNDFIEPAVKEFAGTYSIIKEQIKEKSTLGQKFFNVAGKILIIAQLSESGQKLIPFAQTLIENNPF